MKFYKINDLKLRNIKHFSVLICSYINTSGSWRNEKLCGNTTPEFFYDIAMSKAQRIRKISVFTSGRKFSVFTLSYVNTAFNQSALRIHKFYIINIIRVRKSHGNLQLLKISNSFFVFVNSSVLSLFFNDFTLVKCLFSKYSMFFVRRSLRSLVTFMISSFKR